jgi:hypothetical protein
MAELEFVEKAFDHDELLAGLEEAADNFGTALSALEDGALQRPTGLSDDERTVMSELNPDVFIPNALLLTESVQEITSTEGYKETEPEYIEAQYAMDAFVGGAVAQNLFAVLNSADARAILPDRTVAVVEVNANRGFPRGAEDNKGCYGLPTNWLGHIVIDLNYEGVNMVEGRDDRRRIDFLGEPGSWTTFGIGLDRNAARIRIRPAYPAHPGRGSDTYYGAPRDVFEKRLDPGLDDRTHANREHSVLRGEYRICRAVALLHDLTDWTPEDFVTRDMLIEEMVQREMDAIRQRPSTQSTPTLEP